MSAVTGRAGGGHSGPAFYEFITSRPIISRIESIVGPEIVGSSVYRIRPKVPGWDQGFVPWHQDSGYFSPACDNELIVTCWIPLVDRNAENGCLRVLPGAYKNGVTRHFRDGHGGYLEIVENDLPPIEPAVVSVPKGGCSVHDESYAPHVDSARYRHRALSTCGPDTGRVRCVRTG